MCAAQERDSEPIIIFPHFVCQYVGLSISQRQTTLTYIYRANLFQSNPHWYVLLIILYTEQLDKGSCRWSITVIPVNKSVSGWFHFIIIDNYIERDVQYGLGNSAAVATHSPCQISICHF